LAVSGLGIAYVTAGFVLVYSGYANQPIKAVLTGFLKGKPPTVESTGPVTVGVDEENSSATTEPVTTPPGNTGAPTATAAANQAIGRLVTAPYGWSTGTQWNDLVSLWNQESGWNNQAVNSSSGAYGIAQALGHGNGVNTQGTVTNEYGGYGVSDAVAQAANSGSAVAQITWGLQYISQVYGNPANAWSQEKSAGSY
jgi:hypothetical protein